MPSFVGSEEFSALEKIKCPKELSKTLNRLSVEILGELPTKLFIGGKFVESISGQKFDVVNPSSGKVLLQVYEADKADVAAAAASAKDAFYKGPWGDGSICGAQRGVYLNKMADVLEKHASELALIESLNNGKPFLVAKTVDIPSCVSVFRYYAGLADKLNGEVMSVPGGYHCFTKREAIGPVGQIIPWNFPLLMAAWKIAPALCCGNTIVIKTAEQTPLSLLRFVQLVQEEVLLPAGVLNVLSGFGPSCGRAIVEHPELLKIAFTGSTEVGKEIMRVCSDSVKKVSLELGGKSPSIVFEDADLDLAAKVTEAGIFFNQGQCCCAGSRVYVHESIYEQFLAKVAHFARSKLVGDPMDPLCEMGPQVSDEQLQKIMFYVKEGQSSGARLVVGGSRIGKEGFFFQPTIFADVSDDMSICTDEIFGPVLCVSKFSDPDDVILRANNSRYGLAAAVFTRDISKAFRVSDRLRAGVVWVNCHTVFDPSMPFGGYKESGIGRELGEHCLEEYLETKSVFIKT